MKSPRWISIAAASILLLGLPDAEAQIRLQTATLAGAIGFSEGGGVRVGATTGLTTVGQTNDDSNANGAGFWYTTLDMITVTGLSIERLGQEIPERYELQQNYPNPFNPTTRLKYGLPEGARVRVSIFNVLGQLVTVLVDKEQAAGFYEVTWQAQSDMGLRLPSGLYFYRIDAGDFSDTRSMILQK